MFEGRPTKLWRTGPKNVSLLYASSSDSSCPALDQNSLVPFLGDPGTLIDCRVLTAFRFNQTAGLTRNLKQLHCLGMDMEGPRIPWNYESWESETCTLLWEVATLSEKTCKNWHFVCQDLSVSPKPSKNRGQYRIIRIPKSTLEKARILQQEHLPQRCCAAQRLNFHTSPLRNGDRFAWPTFWIKKLKGQNKTQKKNIPS